MPNPKRRHSKRRTSTRRAHDHLKLSALTNCSQCGAKTLPHRACRQCGFYHGRAVIEVAE